MTTFLAFVFALLVLVSVHEWGHYRMAVAMGVKVLTFSIGMGPVLWRSRPSSCGTEWQLGALPIGGYVVMLDESQAHVEPPEQAMAFNRQSLGARALIVAAGPVANLLLAVLLFAGVAWWGQSEPLPILSTPRLQSAAAQAGLMGGEHVIRAIALETSVDMGKEGPSEESSLSPVSVQSYNDLQDVAKQASAEAQNLWLEVRASPEHQARWVRLSWGSNPGTPVATASPLAVWGIEGPRTRAEIGSVLPDSPAAQGGLRQGDVVQQINGQSVPDAQFLRRQLRQSLQNGQALPVSLQVERGGQSLSLNLMPQVVPSELGSISRVGAVIGSPPESIWVDHGLWESLGHGVQAVAQMTGATASMVADMVTGRAGLEQLGGPLAIADQAGKSAQLGWSAYVRFLAFLSVSIGLLNLLPLPLLDGGHLMYYLWELLTGKPVSVDWMNALQKVGLMLLAALMMMALVNDGLRLWP
jgi:regulator of sigma E protease